MRERKDNKQNMIHDIYSDEIQDVFEFSMGYPFEIQSSNGTGNYIPSSSNDLFTRIDKRVRKTKQKKHKIGGYITEELYQRTHNVCDALDISLSDFFQAVFSECVEHYEQTLNLK